MTQGAITKKSLFQYGFIALPVAFAGFPLYILAPDFFATQYGLSLALMGGLLLFIRLFDAIQDPIIGWMADRLRGRFIKILGVSGAVLCLSIYALFNAMFFSPAIWFSLCMIFAVSAYSVLSIILGTQATLWTKDKNDQTRIAGSREGFALIGLVVAVSMPVLLGQFVEPEQVYKWYVAILSIFMICGIVIFSRLKMGSLSQSTEKPKTKFFEAFRTLPKESLKLFAVYTLSMLASSIPAVLVIFYVRDLLGAEQMTGLFLMLYFLSGVVAMPFWKNISTRMGKYLAWILSNILAVVGFLGAFYLGAGDIWPYAIVCIVSGLALGADLTLPPSILSDQIHARDNIAFAGTNYAFLAFLSKISLAVASAIALPILDFVGFKPDAANTQNALMTLSAAYALIPCILKLMAAGLTYVFFIRSNHGGSNENFENNRNNRSSHHA